MVGRIPGEDVGEAGLDADPDERELPGISPAVGFRELVVAELLPPWPESVIAMSR